MADQVFDHEKLDVYRLAIEYVGETFEVVGTLSRRQRHCRDQGLRVAQSIPLNFAEGNGIRRLKDRSRFFEIAPGSALECSVIHDVRLTSGAVSQEPTDPMKARLKRIVAMLTRLAMRSDRVSQTPAWYDSPDIDYEHEHLNTRQVYTHVSIERLREVHARTHLARPDGPSLGTYTTINTAHHRLIYGMAPT